MFVQQRCSFCVLKSTSIHVLHESLQTANSFRILSKDGNQINNPAELLRAPLVEPLSILHVNLMEEAVLIPL